MGLQLPDYWSLISRFSAHEQQMMSMHSSQWLLLTFNHLLFLSSRVYLTNWIFCFEVQMLVQLQVHCSIYLFIHRHLSGPLPRPERILLPCPEIMSADSSVIVKQAQFFDLYCTILLSCFCLFWLFFYGEGDLALLTEREGAFFHNT